MKADDGDQQRIAGIKPDRRRKMRKGVAGLLDTPKEQPAVPTFM
jgi:hypothetical protein